MAKKQAIESFGQLAMDLASRMGRAREQGFDTAQRYFTGGINDLKDPHGGPMFLARDPAHANEFAGAGNYSAPGEFTDGEVIDGIQIGGQVTPAFVRMRKPLDTRTAAGKEAMVEILQDLGVAMQDEYMVPGYMGWEGHEIFPDVAKSRGVRGKRLASIAQSNVNDLVYDPAFIQAAEERGYDGLKAMDGIGMESGEVAVPFHARGNVKSTMAGFDPAQPFSMSGAATPSRMAATAAAGGAGGAGVGAVRAAPDLIEAYLQAERDASQAFGGMLKGADDKVSGAVEYLFGPKKYYHAGAGRSDRSGAGAAVVNAMRPGTTALGDAVQPDANYWDKVMGLLGLTF